MDLILLQNAGNAGGGYANLIFMGLLFAVAYFFLIRPQAKRTKEQQKFVTEIEKGDQVVTTSGIYGRVMEVEG
ncbi:MAG: preprotein translocase subunit YajC, partial [Saprospiraceae bacterium]